MRRRFWWVALLCLAAPVVQARVTRIEIKSRAAAFNGQPFGAAGQFEKIKGIASGEIDPKDRRNALITDIDKAPRNARGLVEYRTNFTLVKPVDMKKSSGVLFYNIVNRSNHGGPAEFHVGGDPGDGFLYKLGQAVLWSGWQGDIPLFTDGSDHEGIDVPVARGVTGPVWDRILGGTGNTQSLPGFHGRTPASLDTSKAKLISAVSESPEGVKRGVVEIASSDWAFADCRTTPFPGTPDPSRICLKKGFDPALLYEIVYTAKDPYVLGVGMAAMRDVVSFFRYSEKDDAETANPLAGTVPHVIAMGNSQSGRLAKTFLNLGFNEDEKGRIVWDGLNARIAGMMGGFNVRFAKPGDMSEMYDPSSDGPLWWGDYTDTVRDRPAWGLLHRCTATKTCPKITETYGGPEFWYSRGTVGIAGTTGKEDLPLPENVRRYYHPGTPHGGGRGGFALGTASADPKVFAANPNPEKETDRALYVALVDWVVNGIAPPPSAYPRVSDGTLVPDTSAAIGWPAIPLAPKPDGVVNPVLDYDYGPGFRYNDESGVISNVPPVIKHVIPTLVPKVDADGNEMGGVPSLLQRVPLGTYTGWNPIPDGPLAGREKSLAAGYVPFARTKAERMADGDPRLSIEERYPSAAAYYAAAVKQANAMVQQRLLLPEDAVRLLNQMVTELGSSSLFAH
ncbi:MAG TPA: alpha/beta hydrolase domain-containing protein [Bryobacteraceae bacterium]|nr:alpha/beta hydrolase domain-containing protein [Bryobacteraceae bacterium]